MRNYFRCGAAAAHAATTLMRPLFLDRDFRRMTMSTSWSTASRHYKLAGFSVERLMNLLTAVDQDVEIVIRRKPRSRKSGRISVVGA